MDEAVSFFNSYLDADYAGNLAVRSESDEVLKERQIASRGFWHSTLNAPLSPGFGRPVGMPSEELARLAAKMNPVRRRLFLVAEYDDVEWGALYAGYIGGRGRTVQSYGGLLYAAGINGELKIIASYKEDIDKVPPPLRWCHSQGVEITLSGNPVAIRPLEVPTGRIAHKQDWEAFRNAGGDR
ncbi:hypothetical protein [Streptomyces inusitatus]|nr:hypothetical protein [Streptomyces inusitatus]